MEQQQQQQRRLISLYGAHGHIPSPSRRKTHSRPRRDLPTTHSFVVHTVQHATTTATTTHLDLAEHFLDGAELEDDLGEGEGVLAVVLLIHLVL